MKDVTDSFSHVTIRFVDHISVNVDRLGRSKWFCPLEFDKEVISDVWRSANANRLKVLNLSDFRELRLCGPCGPCCVKVVNYVKFI